MSDSYSTYSLIRQHLSDLFFYNCLCLDIIQLSVDVCLFCKIQTDFIFIPRSETTERIIFCISTWNSGFFFFLQYWTFWKQYPVPQVHYIGGEAKISSQQRRVALKICIIQDMFPESLVPTQKWYFPRYLTFRNINRFSWIKGVFIPSTKEANWVLERFHKNFTGLKQQNYNLL